MNFPKIRSFLKIGGWKKNRNSLNYDLSKAIFGMKMARELGHCMMVWILKTKTKNIIALPLLVQFFTFTLVNHDKHGNQIFFDLLKKFHRTQKFY